jgi:putative endonuclease
MAEHNEFGKKGEEMAQKHLLAKGYKIIATNWRYGKDEIDIVAKHNNFLVIVEVKTRSTNAFGDPEEAVSKKKKKFLVRAADAYINMKSVMEEVRFDIISIVVTRNHWEINHIEDAFYPTIN